MEAYPLRGYRAWIGGGSKGIGFACACALAEVGASVTIVARDEAALQRAYEQLPIPLKQQHYYLVMDYDEPHAVEERLKAHLDELQQGYHILIHNSGGPPSGLLVNTPASLLEQTFIRHLKTPHIITQLLLPFMQQVGFGRIINILSTSVKQPIPRLGLSNAIRAAVANWAKTLSMEVAIYGITVNSIMPGATKTERLAQLFEAKARQEGVSPQLIAMRWLRQIPVRRFAEPEEIAAAVRFLCLPEASYINGVLLAVDGGRTVCL